MTAAVDSVAEHERDAVRRFGRRIRVSVKPVVMHGHSWEAVTWLYRSFECCFTFEASAGTVFAQPLAGFRARSTLGSMLLAQTGHTAVEHPVKIGMRSRGSAMQKIEHAMPRVDRKATIAAVRQGRQSVQTEPCGRGG